MKRFLLYIILCGAPFAALAQNEIEFSEMAHNLGTLMWHHPAQATFTVKNLGQEELNILDVEPDCGCTLVSWTTQPIAPGQTGTVSVRYDAQQLGHFNKGVAVYTNFGEQPTYLSVTGRVVNEPVSKIVTYDHHFGVVDLNVDEIEFDDVNRGETPFRVIELCNNGKEPVTPTLMHLPDYLTASYAPDVLYPGRSGRILVTLDSEKLPMMGLTQDNVYLSLQPGETLRRENEITVSATLLPPVVEDEAMLENSPVLELDKTALELGEMGKKSKLKGQMLLTNTGRSDLNIQALQVYNPGLSVSLGSRVIRPGGTEKLKVTVSELALRSKGRRRILLITDDARNPKRVIDVIVKK